MNATTSPAAPDEGAIALLRSRLRLLVAGPLAIGVMALGATYLIEPTFTAATTFMPPQQSQSGAATALASLGALANLAGAVGGVRATGDQYVSMLQSVTLRDRIIEHFGLDQAYKAKFRADTRQMLANNVRVTLGKKDGWITVEVDDKSPQRAAEIANRHVQELRMLSGSLAVTEAQQRRVFFEQQLAATRDRLKQAQAMLQASGFNPDALKAEPKSAAEAYARLRAELTGAEVQLQTLRGSLTDNAAQVQRQRAAVDALRAQLARVESSSVQPAGPDYVSKYRDYKYQETLFELYARQFELARADESREGNLIQVIDAATPPERKSHPKRAVIAVGATLAAAMALAAWVVARGARRSPAMGPAPHPG